MRNEELPSQISFSGDDSISGLSLVSRASTLIPRKFQGIINTLIVGGMAAKWAYGKYTDWKEENSITRIAFESGDPAYNWVIKWIQSLPEARKAHSFEASAPIMINLVSKLHASEVPPTAVPAKSKLSTLTLTPAQNLNFRYKGVEVTASASVPEQSKADGYGPMRKSIMLVIYTRDERFILDMLMEIEAIGTNVEERVPMVYYHKGDYSGWKAIRPCPSQRNVILPGDEFSRLKRDIEHFMERKEWYDSVGVPYRRGYLLHGIPGSGKTSTVLALAASMDLNVCVLNLANSSNSTFQDAMDFIPERSLLVLEDIDSAFHGRDAADDDSKITFSGLLNALDGATTPDGRITFMTTNHREKLDPALIRPGRVDMELEYKNATEAQITELARRFGAGDLAKQLGHDLALEGMSMATAQERLLQLYR